jgi:periplasmic protein CpxP/Spy
MIRPRHLVQSLLLASTLGAMAIPAFADMPCGPMGGAGGYREHRAEHIEQHHKKVHDALKLTAEQDVAWKKLVESERPMMGPRDASMAEDWAKLTTPERAEKMLERMKTHEAAMSSHIVLLKEFYAVLTPEQKKIFDDSHNGMRRGGMRGMHGKHMAPPAAAPVKP